MRPPRILAILPGMFLPSTCCGDCRSCDRYGICHVARRYTGLWSATCSRFRKRTANQARNPFTSTPDS